MEGGYGVVIETHPRNGAMLLRDSAGGQYPITAMVLHPELELGITLHTPHKADLGVSLKRALEERGVNRDNIQFSGAEGPNYKNTLTITGYAADQLAGMLTQNHPMYPDDRFRSHLCAPAMASTLAKGYQGLTEELQAQEAGMHHMPFN